MTLVQATAVSFGVMLLASAVYMAGLRDEHTGERVWSALRSTMARRKAWWLGPIGAMVLLVVLLMIGSTQAGCAFRIYSLF
jgi:hypothetical protein